MVAVATRAYNVAEQVPAAPVAKPMPVDRDEHAATHCPLCGRSLWARVRGLWCEPCQGWLVEELRDGQRGFSLWQGSV